MPAPSMMTAPAPVEYPAPPAASGGLGQQLTVLAAFTKELELQSHLLHLNYTGENFIALHSWLKGRYEAHLEQFDTLAELVRIQGEFLPGSTTAFRDVLPAISGEATIEGYVQNLRAFSELAKALEPIAADARAIDVANYLAELVGDAGKAVWFLSASSGC
ncbi:MAG: ferritin-like domain-containing protein [Synechococcaceae cyanobacterium]|nr:ferritin-like domain-containing protein [Synechococcaceae cyanobacterium]